MADTINRTHTVSSLAEDCMERSKHVPSIAADLMVKRLNRDEQLYAALHDKLMLQACVEACSLVMRRDRYDTRRQVFPTPPMNTDVSVLQQGAVMQMKSWLNYGLVNGAKLGDATAADLQDEITQHRKFEAANRRQARFYAQIAAKLGKKKRVREVFTHEMLKSIFAAL